MKKSIRIVGHVKIYNGKHYVKEDHFDMDVNDFFDYINIKYISRGNKLAALPIRLINEISRIDSEGKQKIDEVLRR